MTAKLQVPKQEEESRSNRTTKTAVARAADTAGAGGDDADGGQGDYGAASWLLRVMQKWQKPNAHDVVEPTKRWCHGCALDPERWVEPRCAD